MRGAAPGGEWRKPMTAKELKLDYFKLYDVENVAAKYRVTLKGQFDNEPVGADLTVLDFFANPAVKNGEPLFDKSAHLTVYRLFQEKPEPTRLVRYANQFGEFEIKTGNAFGLLVPAKKHESGLELSKELGHYKLYWVVEPGKAPERTVKLKDQFRTEEVAVGGAVLFGVPVEKTYRRKVSGITNPEAHLVIYRIPPRTVQKQIKVTDQFGERGLTVIRSLLVAAPAIKLRWKTL